MKHAFFLFTCIALWPLSAGAAVVINEVAWMGTSVSANDEWIELYNDGTDHMSLDGWRLSGEDGAPSIALSGVIEAGGYFLLERSDDASVPDVPADLIFTGAIGNDTEHLTLSDASGTKIDEVQSGENWSLGGDNTTKHTAQRQGDGSWITGVPTPRAANSTENTKKEKESGEVAGTSTTKKTSTAKTTNGYVQRAFSYAGPDIGTVAGASAFFDGYGVDEKGERLEFARYSWNFGDGATDRRASVHHIYHFPGTYTAVLSVSGKEQKSRDKVVVRVTEPAVSIGDVVYGPRGFITVRNESEYELDLSGWELRLKSGEKEDKTFSFPNATLLAPNTSIPFPAVITDMAPEEGDRIDLILPSGKTVASR
ncbi:MAG: hypothetical protein AMXMBFR44_1250 [Candidatus Campbellbacteria bacterium]